MRFGVALELDGEAERNADALHELTDTLAGVLDQDYGPGLQNLTIGIICIRFRNRQRVRLIDGTSTELFNAFSYDVRLSHDEFEHFVSASPRAAVELISAKLVASLRLLNQLPSTAAAFDRRRFEADFERGVQIALEDL